MYGNHLGWLGGGGTCDATCDADVAKADAALDEAAARLGARRLKMPRDGNCQFHSLSQFQRATWRDFKMTVIEVLRADSATYAPYVTEDEEWEAYLSRIARPQEYGDHVTLQAAAHALDAHVWVLRSDDPHRLRRVGRPSAPTARAVTVTFRGADTGHYDALRIPPLLRQQLATTTAEFIEIPKRPPKLPLGGGTPRKRGVQKHNRRRGSASAAQQETLGVVSINVQLNLTGRVHELRELATVYNPALILVQETGLGNTAAADPDREADETEADVHAGVAIDGYQKPSFVHRRTARSATGPVLGGGVGVYVKLGLPHEVKRMPALEQVDLNGDYQEITVYRKSRHPLRLVNAYSPPTGSRDDVRTNTFSAALKALPTKRTIIAGDLNARHPEWCVKGVNASGTSVHEWTAQHDLRVMNNRARPTRLTSKDGASSPDVVISSGEPDVEVTAWTTLDDIGSDHVPMWFEFPGTPPAPSNELRWIHSKTDKGKFAAEVVRLLETIDQNVDLDSHCDMVTDALWQAAEVSVPRRTPKPWWKPWWSDETQAAIDGRRAAKKTLSMAAAHGEDTEAPREALRTAEEAARAAVTKAKMEKFRQDLSTLDRRAHPSALFKKIRALTGQVKATNTAPLRADGKWHIDSKDRASVLAKHFAEVGKASADQDWEGTLASIEAMSDEPANEPVFTLEELVAARKDIDARKAAGPDGLPSDFLLLLPDDALPHVLALFNKCWRSLEIPAGWRTATIRPLLKATKPAMDPSSYRPIWLTSTLCKWMERTVKRRLDRFTEAIPETRLDLAQGGGRKGRDAEEQIGAVTETMRQVLRRGQHAVMLYVDFTKAFDTVPRTTLLRRLATRGLPKNMVRWLAAFLQNRKIDVDVDGEKSDAMVIEDGVPQGSVLGPTLYLLFLDDLLAKLRVLGIHAVAYVDDLTVLIKGDDLHKVLCDAQGALNIIDSWCVENGVALSAQKTMSQYIGHGDRGVLPWYKLYVPSTMRRVSTAYDRDEAMASLEGHCNFAASMLDPAATGQKRRPSPLAGCKAKILNGVPLREHVHIARAWRQGPIVEGERRQEWTLYATVEWTTCVKYLGVRIDAELRFEEQVEHACRQHAARVAVLSRLAGSTWGCTTGTLRMVYKTFAEPALTWGLAVWGPHVTTATRLRISKLQTAAARRIANLVPTANRHVALAEADLVPFDAMIKAAAVQLGDRVIRTPGTTAYECTAHPDGLTRTIAKRALPPGKWPPTGGWLAVTTQAFRDAHVAKLRKPPTPAVPTTPAWEMTGKATICPAIQGHSRANLTAIAVAAKLRVAELERTADTAIYTDGSVIGPFTAGGIWTKKSATPMPERLAGPTGAFASTKRAEMRAILVALEQTLKSLAGARAPGHTRNVVVFSDSQSGLRELLEGELRQRTVEGRKIWGCIRRLADSDWQTTMQYVPSHVGIAGNDRADDIANGTAQDIKRKGQLGPDLPYGAISKRIAVQARERNVAAAIDTKWFANTGGKPTKCTGTRREGERVIRGLATGQHWLLIPKMQTDGQTDRACQHCGAPKRDSQHLLVDCAITGSIAPTVAEALSDPRAIIEKLVATGDLPGGLEKYLLPQKTEG
jgi:ribonuclease HI